MCNKFAMRRILRKVILGIKNSQQHHAQCWKVFQIQIIVFVIFEAFLITHCYWTAACQKRRISTRNSSKNAVCSRPRFCDHKFACKSWFEQTKIAPQRPRTTQNVVLMYLFTMKSVYYWRRWIQIRQCLEIVSWTFPAR